MGNRLSGIVKSPASGDIVWTCTLVLLILLMISPWTGGHYKEIVADYPYVLGFAKFFVLASMGELMTIRLMSGSWSKPLGFWYKALLWGFYGMMITLAFKVFAAGTQAAMQSGLLPGGTSPFLFALFASLTMNAFFAPFLMSMHKVTDTYIEKSLQQSSFHIPLETIISSIQWSAFISFVILKTIPFFWVPAHTISFLLPPDVRVALAAVLSIAFGAITAYTRLRNQNNVQVVHS
jgi:hypothetical protein